MTYSNEPSNLFWRLIVYGILLLILVLVLGCSGAPSAMEEDPPENEEFTELVVFAAPPEYEPSERFFTLAAQDQYYIGVRITYFNSGVPNYIIPEIWVNCAYTAEELGLPDNEVMEFWGRCVNTRLTIKGTVVPAAFIFGYIMPITDEVLSVLNEEWAIQALYVEAGRLFYTLLDVWLVCGYEAEHENTNFDPNKYWHNCILR